MILGPNGQPLTRPQAAAPKVRARYDAAVTDHENKNHWANVDHFSARAANNIQVRRILRDRARYERANNSYCAGIILTLANDTIGTGPRLQVNTEDESLNETIAKAWEEWSRCAGLAQKLHTMRQSRAVDGEAFALLVTNPRLGTDVQLDLKLLDAEQVSTPFPYPLNPHVDDGMVIDDQGNVVEWHVLKYHPGDMFYYGFPFQFDRLSPSHVIQWFRADRPWQFRGVPEITPALPLFAQLRRYTLAVLAAAETAADFAAVIQTDMPPDSDDFEVGTPFETMPIDKRMMTTLPAGYKLGQFKAEQPAQNYEMFKDAILNEIARCMNMPFNVAAGNSKNYNYSSGRLDHQTYHKAIGVDRNHLERNVLEPVFTAWVAEARLATSIIPADLQTIPYQWYWDGFGHVDPAKEANAQETRLASCTTTLAHECAREGRDWRQVIRQRAREIAEMRSLGLPIAEPSGTVLAPEVDESDDTIAPPASAAHRGRNGFLSHYRNGD